MSRTAPPGGRAIRAIAVGRGARAGRRRDDRRAYWRRNVIVTVSSTGTFLPELVRAGS